MAAPESPNTVEVNEKNDDSLSELLDMNSEPAVEDLMRQIMSEAKIWEAVSTLIYTSA